MVPLTELVVPVVEQGAAGKDPDDLLFPSPEGEYLRSGNWRRRVHWDTTSLGGRRHDLRHTAASLWISSGVDIKTVSVWLGHSTAKLTLDTYGHSGLRRRAGGPLAGQPGVRVRLGSARGARITHRDAQGREKHP